MHGYLRVTRSLTYSLLFAMPLLVLYEVGAAMLAAGPAPSLRNGADVLLRSLFAAVGIRGTAAFSAVLLAVAAVLIVAERRRRRIPLRGVLFAGMALESAAYALTLGVVVGTATQWILRGLQVRLAAEGAVAALTPQEAIILSLGAGIYEELVFRVLLVGGIYGVFRSSGLRRGQAGAFSALLAAALFSAFHYVGPYADAWQLPSFLFRFLAGLTFSVLFLVRGFGIAAWTHALYDVFLFAARGM